MIKVNIGFIGLAKGEYERLIGIIKIQKNKGIHNSEEQQLLKSIKRKGELIEEGINKRDIYGEKIHHNEIPKEFSCFGHLWKVRLTGYWRMLYTIDSRNHPEIVAIILDILDHEKYNKRFKK